MFFGKGYRKKSVSYLIIVKQPTHINIRQAKIYIKFHTGKVWQDSKSAGIIKSGVVAGIVAPRVGHHVSDQQPAEQPSRQSGP